MSRKAMKQALDTLERRHAEQSYPQPEYLCAAIAALRATLAKAPEPHCTYPACEPATVGGCDGPCGQALSGATLAEAPEPVAWACVCDERVRTAHLTREAAELIAQNLREQNRGRDFEFRAQPLYTAPPARKPLTDEQILDRVACASKAEEAMFVRFARAVERAHGITGEQE